MKDNHTIAKVFFWRRSYTSSGTKYSPLDELINTWLKDHGNGYKISLVVPLTYNGEDRSNGYYENGGQVLVVFEKSLDELKEEK